VIEQDPGGNWHVSFNFGRIGFPGAWAQKVEGVSEQDARAMYSSLVGEKLRKGYEIRPWPASLALPSGEAVQDSSESTAPGRRGVYGSTVIGQLPGDPPRVEDIALPPGRLLAPTAEGGPRGQGAVLWVSDEPLKDVVDRWRRLASVFTESGLWPLVIEPTHGIERMVEAMMDLPRTTGADPFQLLRRWRHASVGDDEDVDAVGWMGPANYDMNPTEQSAILDTWEDRFDAYIVAIAFDTITLAVGRPPRDLASATAIAAEHMAFCPDNIWQGVGSIVEYAPPLVDADRWDFWWD